MRASSPNSRKLTSGWRSSAMAAPGTTTAGPSSPPIASSDMVRGAAMTPMLRRFATWLDAVGRTGPTNRSSPENDRP